MEKSAIADEALQKAFDLAYFIHGEKAAAIQIVIDAAEKLDVAVMAQDKRLYYRPKGHLTKVSLSKLHLLQRLIYVASEPYEREAEARNARQIDQRRMVIHFVKHLVRITLKRNSFYVALGASRLLHTYTTAETMQIYDALQASDRSRDDSYYRARKGILMRELADRFGELLHTRRGSHGEEIFEAVEGAERYADVISESLRRFTPWEMPCLPVEDFRGRKPEDEAEISRMHAILHPPCFDDLARFLGLTPPARSVNVPLFAVAEDRVDGQPPSDGGRLQPEDLARIRGALADKAARRKNSTGLLRILVDGTERARLDPRQSTPVEFDLNQDAEMIEIRSGYGPSDILAAVLILGRDGERLASCQTERRLENGDRLLFAIKATELGATVTIHGEPRPAGGLATPAVWPRWAGVTALAVAASIVIGWLAFQSRVIIPRTPPLPSKEMRRPTPTASLQPTPPTMPVPRRDKASEIAGDFDGTRGGTIRGERRSIHSRAIYLDVRGSRTDASAVRQAITRSLKLRETAKITTAEDADVALKVAVEPQAVNGGLVVTVRLVGVDGAILWPKDGTRRIYRGAADQIGRAIADDLDLILSEARR